MYVPYHIMQIKSTKAISSGKNTNQHYTASYL